MSENKKRYRAVLKVPGEPNEFVYAEITYLVADLPDAQAEAEYIAREYARNFDGAIVDEVTEMS